MVKTRVKGEGAETGKIVLEALTKLKQQTGWTARTIVKFIDSEYGVRGRHMGRRVSTLLRKGVKLGLFEFSSGRYRLVEDRLARHIISSRKSGRSRRGKILRPKPKRSFKRYGNRKRRARA